MLMINNFSVFFLCIIHVIFSSSTEVKISVGCPEQCSCYVVHLREGKSSGEEWSKLKCGKTFVKLDIENLKLNNVVPQIIQLELSSNITYLERSFLKLHFLQKLDISKNGIEQIDDDAFRDLKNLKRLDLSHNKITNLHKKIFEPLYFLERLKLNNNLIVHIFKGLFDHLISLKTLDISENPLDCDCTLIWLMEWSRNSSVKLAKLPTCKSPFSSKGKPLRKLKLHCEDETNLNTISSGLELKPMHNQIVFEGDSLNLRCRSLTIGSSKGESRDAQVTWSWKNKDPTSYFDKIKIENRLFAENGFVESQLKINKIEKIHSGDWYCHLLSDSGNHSTAISVIVLSDDSKYCPQIDTRNNKGLYYWPKTIVGFTVDLPCVIKQPIIVGNKVEPRAIFSCNEVGIWENLNTSHCPFVSETTRILEQFSQVNLSIAKGSVLDSALKLKNFTGDGKNLTDIMDIVFISKTVENYLMFVKNEKELGYVLVDIVAVIMELSKSLLNEAQKERGACSQLIKSLEIICRENPTFQSHNANLALEAFGGTGVFSGIRCVWYLNAQGDKGPKRFFHCSTTNRTSVMVNSDRVMEASIQIPSSLFSQLDEQRKLTHNSWQLIISMYENNNFFPVPSNSLEDVTSCVVGSKLVGIDVTNLTEPVYVMLRAPTSSSTTFARPVWWDQSQNNGSGGWVEEGCFLSHTMQGMVVFHCNRLGYFGLLQDKRYLNDYIRRYNNNKPHLCHPAIYTGSFILIVCLVISIVTYLMSHGFIQMSRRTKHSIVNTWVAISFLCFIFSCGIYQTENIMICQGIGIVLHYLFLSTLLWMSVSASNMYKRLSKSDPLENTPEDDLPTGAPVQKPILGLYLVGWGIGLIVCGISGAVNLKEYAGRNFCFLESGPALSAVYVPAGMLLAFLILFYVLTLCAIRNNDMNGQLSEGTQGTENVDLELLEVPHTLGSVDRRSVQSIVTTDSDDVEDPEHSPIIQLKAHIIILSLYCFIWSLAGLSVTDTFQESFIYYQDICSILYCILAFCLGAFILYFYCVARSDVRSRWTILKKIFKGEKIQCCRSRSISDSHGNTQLNTTAAIPNGTSVQQTIVALSSSSINSSGLTNKTNSHSSNRIKAAKNLNNCDARREAIAVHKTATNNVNLVAMHRQMYRSNNSVPTYHEILGPDSIEAFYNPRQSIVARKFFKKQRRNKRNDLGLRRRGDGGGTSEGEISQPRRTWRPSAESAVFLSSDMENTSEKVESPFFGYSPKVNGTNNLTVGSNAKNIKSKNSNSDEEKINKLPLDRLVIGAEENADTSASVKNSERVSSYDYGLSRVDEISASDEVGAPAIVSLNTTENHDSNGLCQESCACWENGKTVDYRTVELQCSLGENVYPDLNSENCCACLLNEEISLADNGLHKPSKNHGSITSHSSQKILDSVENYPECDSFNEKIDALRLHSDTSLSESPYSKTDYYRTLDSEVNYSELSMSENSQNEKKKNNTFDLPSLSCNDENEVLLECNDIEKAKKETSV